jgi:NitT/TauT family transport system substrate-binding protein
MNVTRREFVSGLTLAGTAGLIGMRPETASAEPPPETTTIRLVHAPAICLSPQYLAEDLLRAEGFAVVEYVDTNSPTLVEVLAQNKADLTMDTAPGLLPQVDAGRRLVAIGGIHGCYELIAGEAVQAVRDLKGKTIAVSELGNSDHVFIASIVAYVGMDPRREINWVSTGGFAGSMRYFVQGKADAFLGFAPQPQELRARKIGRTIVNTTQDRPWSQYFCCMLTARTDFVSRYPIATKRALRAYLKAADICSDQPERAARFLAGKGYELRYELALDVLKGLPFNRWRQYNPEDTLRFHALRLHEAGMIKASPQKIIAQGTDWRFLNELKKELKG